MAELADALDLGSSGATREGSIPFTRTIIEYEQKVGYTLETSLEKLENNQVKVTVTLEASEIQKYIDDTYKTLSKKYRFPGFRPGKAPRKVLESSLGKEAIMGEATNLVVNTMEPKVLDQEDISPLGDPEYDVQNVIEEGKPFTYYVTFNVKPLFELSSYDNVEIEIPFKEATEAEVDQQIERFLGFYTNYEDSKSKRMAKKGDVVSISIKGDEKSKFLDNENRLYEIGAGSMPEEFDKEIVGMKPGEEKEFDFKSDESDEEAPSLHVTVKLISHKDKVVPELTDEFAKDKFGFENAADMREKLKEEIQQEKEHVIPQVKEQNAIHELGSRLTDEVPENYRSIVFNDLAQQFMGQLQQQGMSLDMYLGQNGIAPQQFIADLQKQAEDVARESLALDALAAHLKLEATDEDVLNEFKESGSEDPEKTFKEFKEQGRIPSIRDFVRRSKAIDHLLEHAKMTEVDMIARAKEEVEKEAKAASSKKSTTNKSVDKKESEKVEDKKAPAKKTSKKTSSKAKAEDKDQKADK